jgi:chaperone modulatory protein CbpM
MAIEDDALWLHARQTVSLVELARCSGMAESELRELVDYGGLAPAESQAPEWAFSAEWIVRVRAAARLRRDLELETPALALVLAYLERIDRLEAELRRLHALLPSTNRNLHS